MRQISRRDFMNGIAIAIAGAGGPRIAGANGAPSMGTPGVATPGVATPAGAGPVYPPGLSGLRGSHVGSFEAAHRLRDGERYDLTKAASREPVDLAIVGGGISGLATAHFYRRLHPKARILILDTNDDFGGHAKRNEFDVDGRMLLGYGGTQSIDGPRHKWSKTARGVLKDLGIDVTRLGAGFDQTFYSRWGLNHGVFFKKEAFGVDKLVRQPFGRWSEWDEQPDATASLKTYLSQFPLNDRAKGQLFDMYTSDRDVLAGKSPAERTRILEHTSYRDFLKTYWDADEDVLKHLQTRTHGLWAIGIDAVPASEAFTLPGMKAQRAAAAAAGLVPPEEPYIYHFPDGNASIARMLVRSMIPGAASGHTMEDIVDARFDYSALDRDDNPVRIRLNSTALEVRNVAQSVEVTYLKSGVVEKVAAGHCVLACNNAMIPYIAPDVPEPQRAALHESVRAPLVYVNLAARNWHAWHKLGIAHVVNAGGMFDAYLDFPVSIGRYAFAADPSQPLCIHLEHMPTAPNQGLNMRDQYRRGRAALYTTSFADFESVIRDELSRMLAGGGFDFDRDIAAITVNRWPHGYAYTPTPLYDDPVAQEKLMLLARRPVGRISIANSDAGWDAYTHVAIDQAHRAVMELRG